MKRTFLLSLFAACAMIWSGCSGTVETPAGPQSSTPPTNRDQTASSRSGTSAAQPPRGDTVVPAPPASTGGSTTEPEAPAGGETTLAEIPPRNPPSEETVDGNADASPPGNGVGDEAEPGPGDIVAGGGSREPMTLVAAFPSADGKVGLKSGDLIPEIVGNDIEGTEFRLSDYEGKVIMLDFWGDW